MFQNYAKAVNLFQRPKQPKAYYYQYDNVLGTTLDLKVSTKTIQNSDRAKDVLFSEIDRLEAIYSRFDATSELNQWQNGALATISEDLKWLIQEAAYWVDKTDSAFHPGADVFTQLWQDAQREGQLPSLATLEAICDNLAKQSIHVGYETNSEATFNFNAIAKGRIVDQAIQCAYKTKGISGLSLNIGGDLRHIGEGEAIVEIANAFSKADNVPALCNVRIDNQAIATSGLSHRGFDIAGSWYSHVIDPRTGWPSSHIQSVSVIAPDCATADVLATSFSICEPKESIALANSLQDVGCLLITKSGETISNNTFDTYII